MVGRDAELAAVGRFLDRLRGEPSALLVEGEAGIGKTTIWLAAIDERRVARCPGAASATCRERGSALLCAPSPISSTRCSTRLDAPCRLCSSVLWRLRFCGRRRMSRPQARTTATALVGVLASVVRTTGPLLVAIDDVQWLDPASAAAIAFVARRLPVGAVSFSTRRGDPEEDPPLGSRSCAARGRARADPARAVLSRRAASPALGPARLGAASPRACAYRGGVRREPVLRARDRAGARRRVARPLSGRAVAGPARSGGARPRARQRPVRGARLAALACAALVSADRSDWSRERCPEREQVDAGCSKRRKRECSTSEPSAFASPIRCWRLPSTDRRRSERRRQLHERLAAIVTDPEERAHHLALCTTEPDEAVAAELEQAAAQAANAWRAAGRRGALRRRGPADAAESSSEASSRDASSRRSDGLALPWATSAGAARSCSRRRGRCPRRTPSCSRPPAARRDRLGGRRRRRDRGARRARWSSPRAIPSSRPSSPQARERDGGARSCAYRRARPGRRRRTRPGTRSCRARFRLLRLGVGGDGPRERTAARAARSVADARGASRPDAPKSLFGVFYINAIDDFDAARARFAAEDRWYRERGDDVWRAERRVHYGSAELRAGQFELGERLVEEGCDTIAQIETPGRGRRRSVFARSWTLTGEGPRGRGRRCVR